MIQFNKAKRSEISVIQKLSTAIWQEVYPSIITVDQINYMLEKMYSTEALLHQMEALRHQFVLMVIEKEPIGFASFSVKSDSEPHRYRLHKLYLRPNLHGKGYGRMAIDHISDEIKALGGSEIELNVNKKNPAIGFYQKTGFFIERDEVIDIGNGYVMDDHIMLLKLNKTL